MTSKFSAKYLPRTLSKRDQKRQEKMLLLSRKLYKKNLYYTRKPLSSYKSKLSKHVITARKMYKTDIIPSKALSVATGCPLTVLKKIVNKGEGAYYSSGSRPNQTPQSWGIARLASSISGGNAAKVDFHLIKKCNHSKKAFKMAKQRLSL
jgi:hypothetical protein